MNRKTFCTAGSRPTRASASSTGPPSLRAAGLMLVLAGAPVQAGALDWSLRADGLAAGELRGERVRVERTGSGGVDAVLEGLTVPLLGGLGQFGLVCPPQPVPCRDGRLERRQDDGTVVAAARWSLGPEDLAGTADGLALARAADGWALHFENLDLAAWLTGVDARLTLQSGLLSGRAQVELDGGRAEVVAEALSFDTADGRYAGADLRLEATADWGADGLDATLSWPAGELLLGPAYLPSPPVPVELRLKRSAGNAVGPRVRASIDADGLLALDLDARGDLLLPERFTVDVDVPSLAALWPLGPESIAASAGWPSLDVDGRLTGALEWRDDRVERMTLGASGVAIDDPAGRLELRGLDAEIERREQRDRIALSFRDAQIYRLPLGPSALVLAGPPDALRLDAPARIPILDGALRLDRLTIDRAGDRGPRLELDAVVEPLDLAALTERLGWPRFGGLVSGRFPGVQFERDTLRVAGGLDLDVFDGTARIEDLAVERPFGTLPALSGTLKLDRLDLAPLTAAFDFGAMQGSLSGHVRELRLLDWQPVAFDAWLFTPSDSRRPRRISQRAVDQIASLGGGGGAAALSAPLLSLFDDFAYTQIGLGCRLAGNVCRMRGLEDVEGGGYRIVEGRGLPRLDVVGFRRQVDWPVLLAQLQAATRGDGPSVGD